VLSDGTGCGSEKKRSRGRMYEYGGRKGRKEGAPAVNTSDRAPGRPAALPAAGPQRDVTITESERSSSVRTFVPRRPTYRTMIH